MDTLFKSKSISESDKDLKCSMCDKYINTELIDSVFYIDLEKFESENDKLGYLVCDHCCEKLIKGFYTYQFVDRDYDLSMSHFCKSSCDICYNTLYGEWSEWGTKYYGYISNNHNYILCESCSTQVKE